MGCDGIWETFSNEEVASTIQGNLDNKLPLDQILTKFLDLNLAKETSSRLIILDGKGCDNMTAILIVFKK